MKDGAIINLETYKGVELTGMLVEQVDAGITVEAVDFNRYEFSYSELKMLADVTEQPAGVKFSSDYNTAINEMETERLINQLTSRLRSFAADHNTPTSVLLEMLNNRISTPPNNS